MQKNNWLKELHSKYVREMAEWRAKRAEQEKKDKQFYEIVNQINELLEELNKIYKKEKQTNAIQNDNVLGELDSVTIATSKRSKKASAWVYSK